MRLEATDPDAKYVRMVKLDNKVVPLVKAFDTEEGWVESYMPQLNHEKMHQRGDIVNIDEDNQNEHSTTVVRRYGKVEVFMHDPSLAD